MLILHRFTALELFGELLGEMDNFFGKACSAFRKAKTGVQGFEPQLTDPETVVLPLHYTPVLKVQTIAFQDCFVKPELTENNR